MSPALYRRVTVAALVAVCLIVVTGAAVRLSGSGLGCADWPNCNTSQFIDVSTTHGAIEQVNRLFTGVVMVAVVAAVLGAVKRRPRRKDLTRLAVLIALGVPMQGVVGAIVVKTDLNPFANQQHFLLSMVLVGLATVLVHRAAEPDGEDRLPTVGVESARLAKVVVFLTALALVTGTFVTGAGPHAGDETAQRFHVAISSVARVHSISVLATIGLGTVLYWKLRQRHADRHALEGPLMQWTVVAVGQVGLGYTQYFSGVPAVLVGVHVAIATVLWWLTIRLWLATSACPTTVVAEQQTVGRGVERVGNSPSSST